MNNPVGDYVNARNIQDIRTRISFSLHLTPATILNEIEYERSKKNRDTVIALLEKQLPKDRFFNEYAKAFKKAQAKGWGIFSLGSKRTKNVQYFIGEKIEWRKLEAELWPQLNHAAHD